VLSGLQSLKRIDISVDHRDSVTVLQEVTNTCAADATCPSNHQEVPAWSHRSCGNVIPDCHSGSCPRKLKINSLTRLRIKQVGLLPREVEPKN
jgi:hypothetical protein